MPSGRWPSRAGSRLHCLSGKVFCRRGGSLPSAFSRQFQPLQSVAGSAAVCQVNPRLHPQLLDATAHSHLHKTPSSTSVPDPTRLALEALAVHSLLTTRLARLFQVPAKLPSAQLLLPLPLPAPSLRATSPSGCLRSVTVPTGWEGWADETGGRSGWEGDHGGLWARDSTRSAPPLGPPPGAVALSNLGSWHSACPQA